MTDHGLWLAMAVRFRRTKKHHAYQGPETQMKIPSADEKDSFILWLFNRAMENDPFKMIYDDLPIKDMVNFHSYVK